MMSQMGQKPSEAKVQQTYRNIVKHAKTAIKTKNKSVLALKRLVMK